MMSVSESSWSLSVVGKMGGGVVAVHDFADGCGDGADVMRLVKCGLGTDSAVAADCSWRLVLEREVGLLGGATVGDGKAC